MRAPDPVPWRLRTVERRPAQWLPVGLIDWDYAYPGPPFDDVAYALQFVTPFRPDEECLRWLRYPTPPDRRRRVEVVLEAYGSLGDLPIEDVVDGVIERQRHAVHLVELLASRGVQPHASWIESGYLDNLRGQRRWSEEHRHLVERPDRDSGLVTRREAGGGKPSV